jgi:hypothetical protein
MSGTDLVRADPNALRRKVEEIRSLTGSGGAIRLLIAQARINRTAACLDALGRMFSANERLFDALHHMGLAQLRWERTLRLLDDAEQVHEMDKAQRTLNKRRAQAALEDFAYERQLIEDERAQQNRQRATRAHSTESGQSQEEREAVADARYELSRALRSLDIERFTQAYASAKGNDNLSPEEQAHLRELRDGYNVLRKAIGD